jgi:hypothetical protein
MIRLLAPRATRTFDVSYVKGLQVNASLASADVLRTLPKRFRDIAEAFNHDG